MKIKKGDIIVYKNIGFSMKLLDKETYKNLPRKIFLWIFRKQVADIIHNHSESIQLRHTIKLHKSGLSSFVEALEFIVGDIEKYFMLGSGLSARNAMKEMKEFCSLKLNTLRKLLTEYEELEGK